MSRPILLLIVGMLLGVSNTKPERYLNELEHKCSLKQIGKSGRYVHYEAI